MHFQWQRLNITLTRPEDRLWHLIAQMMLFGGRYTGDMEKCYNSMFLAVNEKFNFSVPVFQIGNGENSIVIVHKVEPLYVSKILHKLFKLMFIYIIVCI